MRTLHPPVAAVAAMAAVAAFGLLALASPAARAQSGDAVGPSGATGAAVAIDAFSAAVAVADRGEAERSAAYAAALRRVLLDNASDRTLMNRDDVRAALRDAAAYVETFRFDVPEPGSGIPPGTPVTETVRLSGEAAALLRVRFDRLRVLALIDADRGLANGTSPVRPTPSVLDANGASGSGLPVGVAERAFEGIDSVLVWLLVEDGERVIAGSDPSALKVRERLREIAGGAGVTVAFGAADELDPGTLRALDAAAIGNASLRYATDAVLVGRLARRLGDPAEPSAGAETGAGGAARPVVVGPDADGAAANARAGGARAGAAGIDLRGRVAGPTRPSSGSASGWSGDWLKLAARDADAGPASRRGAEADDTAPALVALRTVTRGERLDDALRDGMGWLLPELVGGAGAGYAYGGRGDAAEGLVWVGSLDSIGEYARVMALFESVASVESVYPRTVADGAGVFVVRPRGALQAILGAAAGTDWLRRGAPPVSLTESGGGAFDAATGAGDPIGARGARAVDRVPATWNPGDPVGGPAARVRARPAPRETLADLARQVDLAFDVLP